MITKRRFRAFRVRENAAMVMTAMRERARHKLG